MTSSTPREQEEMSSLGPTEARNMGQESLNKAKAYLKSDQRKPMHPSTFEYLKPTDDQIGLMTGARSAVQRCAMELETLLPDGPDKTYLLRMLREVGMWANVAITRLPDGTPRT